MTNDTVSSPFLDYADGGATAVTDEWLSAVSALTEPDLVDEAQKAFLSLSGKELTDALDALVMQALADDSSEHVRKHRLGQAIDIALGALGEYVSIGIRSMVEYDLSDQDTDPFVMVDIGPPSLDAIEFEGIDTDPVGRTVPPPIPIDV